MELQIFISKLKLKLIFQFSLFLVLGFTSSFFFENNNGMFLRIVFILLAGALVFWTGKRIKNPKPVYVINEKGVEICSKIGFIPWSDVTGVSISNMNNNQILWIEVDDLEKYRGRLPDHFFNPDIRRKRNLKGIPMAFMWMDHTAQEVLELINSKFNRNFGDNEA